MALSTRARSGVAHSFASMIGLASRRAEDEDGRRAGYDDPEKKEKPPEGKKGEDKPKDEPAAKSAEDGDEPEMVDCPECDGDGEDDEGHACKACDGTGKVEADDDDAEGKKGKKSKKARAEGDDKSGDDREDEGKKAERNRWGFVMAKAIPAGKAVAACALLHDTPMTAAKIVQTLAALPADAASSATRESLDGRMNRAATPTIGPDARDGGRAPAGAKAIAARMQDVYARATGRKAAD